MNYDTTILQCHHCLNSQVSNATAQCKKAHRPEIAGVELSKITEITEWTNMQPQNPDFRNLWFQKVNLDVIFKVQSIYRSSEISETQKTAHLAKLRDDMTRTDFQLPKASNNTAFLIKNGTSILEDFRNLKLHKYLKEFLKIEGGQEAQGHYLKVIMYNWSHKIQGLTGEHVRGCH